MQTRRLIILGSTGSIGTQTLDTVAHLNALADAGASPRRFEVVGLAAGNNAALLAQQAQRFGVSSIALESDAPVPGFEGRLVRASCHERSLRRSAAEALVRSVDCDLVVASIVGAAGLPATLAAVELGRDVALANKETLVAAGELVVPLARRTGSRLLPVDSEHSGLWQCLTGLSADPDLAPPFEHPLAGISRVTLTASGGPFRTWSRQAMHAARPADALKHPVWAMGAKVSIDSASLMNKALEIIEAHWLFGLAPEQINAIVHPQSIVHALVETRGSSTLAQLAAPDMRTPIQHALCWPDHLTGALPHADLAALGRLDFEAIDRERFPAIDLAYRAMRAGGTAGAVLNAANEAAVHAFLHAPADKPLPFGAILELVSAVVNTLPASPVRTLDDVLVAHQSATEAVARLLHAR